MRRRRTVFGFVVTAALLLGVVWAMPGNAGPTKSFSLNVPTTAPAGGTNISYPLTFKNVTPDGNSNIQSLTADVSGGLTIINATAPSGTIAFTATHVQVSNMGPVKPSRTFVVTLTVNVTATDCVGSAVWTTGAWTGTAFGGTAFQLVTSKSQLVTQITGNGCEVRFVPGAEPTNAIKGETITGSGGSTVQVELLQNGSRALWFNGTVSIDATVAPGGAVLSGASVSATNGLASFPALSADTEGDYVVHASALGLSSDDASFSIFFGGIFCNDTVEGTSDDGSTTIELTRTDEGGGDCNDIPYTLTVEHNLVILLKDQDLVRSQGATFEAVITWPDAGNYPNFGTTMVDIDGDGPIPPFVPNNCAVVGGVAQYPVNPDGGGNYYPDGTAEQPWCIAGVQILPSGNGMVAKESFLGSGDPVWSR